MTIKAIRVQPAGVNDLRKALQALSDAMEALGGRASVAVWPNDLASGKSDMTDRMLIYVDALGGSRYAYHYTTDMADNPCDPWMIETSSVDRGPRSFAAVSVSAQWRATDSTKDVP
jgi:hypothetical protein